MTAPQQPAGSEGGREEALEVTRGAECSGPARAQVRDGCRFPRTLRWPHGGKSRVRDSVNGPEWFCRSRFS